ncbi:unnamed protein product [Trifolium pratense]|uniref:Uncharacterized protein n=1 Tax=Trifolium pratense TaxID=57577 RepID=A0ACB0JJF5_TRIPR|nr:unnamed protein product [Trifolium pratense]
MEGFCCCSPKVVRVFSAIVSSSLLLLTLTRTGEIVTNLHRFLLLSTGPTVDVHASRSEFVAADFSETPSKSPSTDKASSSIHSFTIEPTDEFLATTYFDPTSQGFVPLFCS